MSHNYAIFGIHTCIGNQIARHGSSLDHFGKLFGELCCIWRSVASQNNWLYWENSAACTSSFLLSNKAANKPWYVLGVLRWEDRGKREVFLGHTEMSWLVEQPVWSNGAEKFSETSCYFSRVLSTNYPFAVKGLCPADKASAIYLLLTETATLVSGWRVTELHFHDTKEVKISLRALAA